MHTHMRIVRMHGVSSVSIVRTHSTHTVSTVRIMRTHTVVPMCVLFFVLTNFKRNCFLPNPKEMSLSTLSKPIFVFFVYVFFQRNKFRF